jgi:hypothetical protein
MVYGVNAWAGVNEFLHEFSNKKSNNIYYIKLKIIKNQFRCRYKSMVIMRRCLIKYRHSNEFNKIWKYVFENTNKNIGLELLHRKFIMQY